MTHELAFFLFDDVTVPPRGDSSIDRVCARKDRKDASFYRNAVEGDVRCTCARGLSGVRSVTASFRVEQLRCEEKDAGSPKRKKSAWKFTEKRGAILRHQFRFRSQQPQQQQRRVWDRLFLYNKTFDSKKICVRVQQKQQQRVNWLYRYKRSTHNFLCAHLLSKSSTKQKRRSILCSSSSHVDADVAVGAKKKQNNTVPSHLTSFIHAAAAGGWCCCRNKLASEEHSERESALPSNESIVTPHPSLHARSAVLVSYGCHGERLRECHRRRRGCPG